MALLAELAERDARGETAQIYAEIRRLGGVPMVALIFRHLATLPGAIEWTWAAIGPAWRAGLIQEAAWRIARETPVEPLAAMPSAALAALDVDERALAEIRAVLAAYNRANPENLLTVLCLMRVLGGGQAAAPVEPRSWQPPSAPGPLVPMGDVATMVPGMAALLDLVAAPGDDGGARVVQSLYRHFMHRPAFLALAVTLLGGRLADGSIARSQAQLQRAMNTAADEIVTRLSAPAVPHAGVQPALARFGGGVIAQMIVVGELLERALP